MSDDRPTFFSRWSQRKLQVRTDPVPVEPSEPVPLPAAPAVTPAPLAAAPGMAAAPTGLSPAGPATLPASPTLEDVAELSHASDFSRFVAPGVDSNVRNAAMRKLFSDPHFNIMDGLDIYIGDYGKPDPIPPEMLRMMVQSQVLGLFEEEEKAEKAAAEARDAEQARAVEAGEGQTASLGAAGAEGPPPAAVEAHVANAGDAAKASPACGFVAAPAAEAGTDNSHHDHHAHLQLQPDDADRRPGADQGARPGKV